MPISGDEYSFTESNINNSPHAPGVYALYLRGELIYYGSATVQISDRLQDHLSGRDGPCTQQADGYRRELCSNPRQREKELLMEFRAAFGRLPRCNSVMP